MASSGEDGSNEAWNLRQAKRRLCEGVYEWSSVLARPDCIDDLDEFENGEWKRRHPSRTAYLFGSERFELQAPSLSTEVYKMNLSLSDSFVITSGKVSRTQAA